MKISVVTASYNSQATIGFTIESFLAQTHAEKEMLVIDGASSDATLKIVESFGSDAIRVFSAKDNGVYDAMNKGFRLYQGDAVGFLNSDDTFHDSGALGDIAAALQEADIVYGAGERSNAIRSSSAGCLPIPPSTCAGRSPKRSATTI